MLSMLSESLGEIVVITGDFTIHVGDNAKDYKDQHTVLGCHVKNKEGVRNQKFVQLWTGQ